MELHPLGLARLSTFDSGELIDRYLKDVTNQAIVVTTDVDYKALHQSLAAQSIIYNKALGQIRAKEESVQLAALDTIRDRKITTLKSAHNTAKYSDIAAERTAYSKVNVILNFYKGVDKMNYPAESLAVTNLITELRSTVNLPYAQTLGLVPHINNLETANNNFISHFNVRSTDVISTEVFDTKTLRKNMLATYRDLAEYIFVMAKRKNTAYYTTILNTINYGRSYFATIIARHNGGNDDETPPDTE